MSEQVRVQVCHALPGHGVLLELALPAGATLRQAVEASGLLQQCPQIDIETAKLGIFGKLRPADTVVRDGDRVEVYRPLQADPKETRRRRAQHRKAAAVR